MTKASLSQYHDFPIVELCSIHVILSWQFKAHCSEKIWRFNNQYLAAWVEVLGVMAHCSQKYGESRLCN